MPRRCSTSRTRAVMYAYLLGGSAHAFLSHVHPRRVLRKRSRPIGSRDVFLVPTMIQMFVDFPDLIKFDVSSLRRVLYGASPISEALLDRAIARLPNVEFMQGVRHDRALAYGDLSALEGSSGRGASQRPSPLGRPADRRSRSPASSTRLNNPVAPPDGRRDRARAATPS